GEQHDGFLPCDGREPFETGCNARGKIQFGKTSHKIQIVKRELRCFLFGGEAENQLRKIGVASNGDTVARSDTGQKRVRGLKVTLTQKIDGRAELDEKKDLSRFSHGEKVG